MQSKKNVSSQQAKKKNSNSEKVTRQKQENERLKEEIKTLKRGRNPENTVSYKLMPYILFLAGAFLLVCFIIPDKMSFLGYLSYFLCGLFSVGAIFIPICLMAEAFLWKSDARHSRLYSKLFINIGFVVTVSTFCQLVFLNIDSKLYGGFNLIFGKESMFSKGVHYKGGGAVGGVIANFLDMITGFGAWIICVGLLIILAFAVVNITPIDMLSFIRDKTKEMMYNARIKHKERIRRSLQEKKNAEYAERQKEANTAADNNTEDFTDSASSGSKPTGKKKKAFLFGNGEESADTPENTNENGTNENKEMPDLEISAESVRLATSELSASANSEGLGEFAPQSDESTEGSADSNISSDAQIAPDRETYDSIKNSSVHFFKSESEDEDDEQREINLAEIFTEDAVIAAAGVEANTSDVLTGSGAGVPTQAAGSQIDAGSLPEAEKENVKVQPKPSTAELYKFPDIEFLQKDPNPATFTVTDEIKNTSVKLVETLSNFGVKTKITNICCGPTVTRYELQPEIGVRVKSIQNLSDDIALHLAAAGVRIEAPIPGKQAVGIEIPNKTVSTVYIRNLIENPKFAQLKSRLSVCLGMDVAGSPVYMDIAKMPHLLIAGATGMGKSVCINSFIVSLLYKARPDECKLLLIDPKKVEFGVYNGMPHLLVPVVSDPKKAAGSLAWAVNEMERRFQLIEEVGVRDIDSYNKVTENDPEKEHMPKIVIIIDELADLMMTARDSVENSICRIAQKARAAGMHLVIGTQRPSVDVITGLIKANVPSRIACTVASQVDSRTIIDVAGAEKLLGRGDMLYAPVGSMKPIRVQGSFVTDSEIEKIIDFLKSGNEAEYDGDIISSIEREAERCGEKKKGRGDSSDGDDYDVDDRDSILDSDEAIFPAIEVAVNANMISTSLLQRKLSLGYSRASRIVDKLEKLGIVGPFEGSKPRKVLITHQEYMELKMNHGK